MHQLKNCVLMMNLHYPHYITLVYIKGCCNEVSKFNDIIYKYFDNEIIMYILLNKNEKYIMQILII